MKSAIFQDQPVPKPARQPRKSQQNKWPRTASPFVAPAPAATLATWNLEDLISNYSASGQLPPPLSPTLPAQFSLKPADGPSTPKHVASDEDVDTDTIPPSLLSPTLPTMFSKPEPKSNVPALAHPLPEKPSTVHSVLHGHARSANVGKVRWVDKRSDPSKPRFLLRISFTALAEAYSRKAGSKKARHENQHEKVPEKAQKVPEKVREKVTEKARNVGETHETVNGLAISVPKPPCASTSPKRAWPISYKEYLARFAKSAREDTVLSILVQFDWILCTIIQCDAKQRRSASAPQDNISWIHILHDIPLFVQRIERYIKAHGVSDKQKSYLSFLVGTLAVCKAMILKRANAALSVEVDAASRKKASAETQQHIIDTQGQIIRNSRSMEDHFAESQTFFKNSPPPVTVYPRTWAARAQALPRPKDTPMCPKSDQYCLPLGVYSDLSEACAFLYGCVEEFGEAFGVERHGGGRYQLQSAHPPHPPH